MNRSETITKLSSSLVKVQAELKPVYFDAENPFLHNQYATLGAVIEASIPVMNKHGLAITQLVVGGIGQVGVTTILLHESGEYIETTASLNLDSGKGKSLAQEAGSTVTYLRRYSWAAILGLYAEEDVDGNGKGTSGMTEKKVTEKVREAVAEYEVSGNGSWSAAQTNLVTNALKDFAPDPEQASMVLDLSVLPTSAPTKTLNSWLKYVKARLDAGESIMDAAAFANQAYQAATKK